MKKGKATLLSNILMTLGVLSLLYFVMYAVFVDLTNVFTYFWLIIGVILALCKPLATIIYEKQIVIPLTVKWTGGIVITFLLLIFIVTECVIISYGSKEPQPDADYVLVLGAQVKGTRLTYALQTRLDTAYEYAINNPKTMVIVSGGQGPGEQVTEAYAMAEYLKAKGLEEERILQENQSTSTFENIEFSKKLIDSTDAHIVLVTNHFHVYRGVGVAKKQELTNVEGLGAPTKWYTIPNQYVREAFAVVKYKLFGQI